MPAQPQPCACCCDVLRCAPRLHRLISSYGLSTAVVASDAAASDSLATIMSSDAVDPAGGEDHPAEGYESHWFQGGHEHRQAHSVPHGGEGGGGEGSLGQRRRLSGDTHRRRLLTQKDDLLAVLAELGSPSELSATWDIETDPCGGTWDGVFCSLDVVVGLNIIGTLSTVGRPPNSISLLTGLVRLALTDNQNMQGEWQATHVGLPTCA